MLHITIVGAGAYGAMISSKYKKFSSVSVKAVVSRHAPIQESLKGIPFFVSGEAWKKKYGAPTQDDIFDMCVHHNILISVLEEYIHIGARNFIVPKPLALTPKELEYIGKLVRKYKLNVVVASQWHYSTLVQKAKEYIVKNKKDISHIDIAFLRQFDTARRRVYTAETACLPHAVQIAWDLGLTRVIDIAVVSGVSHDTIQVTYRGKIPVTLRSSISTPVRDESLTIYMKGKKSPGLTLDFSGVLGKNGFTVFPSVMVGKKKTEIKEDVLEKMIEKHIEYFSLKHKAKGALTIDVYLPVAQQIVDIHTQSRKTVVVIGGGVFGVMSALEIAKKGFSVVILEKESEIIRGASLVNHGRVHMGYHYPRDKKTVIHSLEAKDPFEKYFGPTVVRKIHNYYMVAREGSMTTHEDFLKFCRKMNLPHTVAWPKNIEMSREKIALSVKVPETIFDAHKKRDVLMKKINEAHNVELYTDAEVTGLAQTDTGFSLEYTRNGGQETLDCAVVINATYGATNTINNFLDLPLSTFQYELCEIQIVKTPWGNTGWMIMDGPFFSAMPFGYSENHLFYDVELSVLERSVGVFPDFKNSISHYDTPQKKKARFNLYKKKWESWVPGVHECEYVSSMYVTRIVLHKEEKTDKRPTIVHEPLSGFWQIFAGKVGTSVPEAQKLALRVQNFLKKKK